jgi:hypothetical protein
MSSGRRPGFDRLGAHDPAGTLGLAFTYRPADLTHPLGVACPSSESGEVL